MTIRNAGVADFPVIRQIAHDTWPVSYGSIISQSQIEYMLDLIYNIESLKNQANNLKHQFILALDSENIPVGFASFSVSEINNSRCRLHKLYVLPDYHNKGIGKIILSHIISEVRLNGINCIELNVNRYNNALHFYLQNNFLIIREEDIDIGNGFFMNDYVMEKTFEV
jgi:GNAT superfamily N-acetyltransferase